jgi:hypothetical protein
MYFSKLGRQVFNLTPKKEKTMRLMSICLICFFSATALADLTVDGTSSPGLDGGVDRFTMYLMDEQLRVDRLITKHIDGKDVDTIEHTILVRFAGEPAGVLLLDHGAKTVKVIATMDGKDGGQSAPAKATPASSARIIKTDETREILGHMARRYDFSFSGSIDPLVMVGQQLPPEVVTLLKINLSVTGTSWVAPGMQGEQEFAGFMEKMAAGEMTIGQTGAGQQGAGGKAGLISLELSSGLKDVMTQLSKHGLPVQTKSDSNMSVAMEGQMAMLMQGMLDSLGIDGNYPSETIATRVDDAEVDAALFYAGGVPDGYTVSFLQ